MCNASIQYLYEETNNLYLNEKVSLFFVGTKFEILYQVPLNTAKQSQVHICACVQLLYFINKLSAKLYILFYNSHN